MCLPARLALHPLLQQNDTRTAGLLLEKLTILYCTNVRSGAVQSSTTRHGMPPRGRLPQISSVTPHHLLDGSKQVIVGYSIASLASVLATHHTHTHTHTARLQPTQKVVLGSFHFDSRQYRHAQPKIGVNTTSVFWKHSGHFDVTANGIDKVGSAVVSSSLSVILRESCSTIDMSGQRERASLPFDASVSSCFNQVLEITDHSRLTNKKLLYSKGDTQPLTSQRRVLLHCTMLLFPLLVDCTRQM